MYYKNEMIPEILEIKPKKHQDARGFFAESFRENGLRAQGFTRSFVQDNHSYSCDKAVLRGLHFQSGSMAQDKLVRCIRGRILDIAVDIRHGSPTFGQHVSAELSAEKWNQLLVPIGFAHGFITLEAHCEVLYKTTNYYSKAHDKGLAFDDPVLGIDWGSGQNIDQKSLLLSAKDKAQPNLNALPQYFIYKGPGYDYTIGQEI